ncbi:MAG: hypothetical protein R3E58_13630 [Phycisphaerae bacterium]
MLVKYCEVEPIELTLDTKVRDWQCYGDGMERTWLHNARLVNNWFDMDAPLAEWKVVLTLGESQNVDRRLHLCRAPRQGDVHS